jgi:hypothetical protein
LSVCIAFNANSILCSIGSLFLHGIERLFSPLRPSSVTYVLNLHPRKQEEGFLLAERF